jgi:hypothetical protein
VADLRSLDENKWLGFEEKLIGNFSKLLGIRIRECKFLTCYMLYVNNKV